MPATIAKEFTLRLGLASSSGKLTALKITAEKKATALTTLCPVCVDEAVANPDEDGKVTVDGDAKCSSYNVGQCGHVPDGAPGYKAGECRKGIDVGQGFVPVNGEEVKAAKQGGVDVQPIIDLTIHEAADVEATTLPSGLFYWFSPTSDDPFFASLAKRLNDPAFDKALVGLVAIKTEERFVRLIGYRGGIVVQELARPHEIENESKSVQPNVKIDGQVGALIDALVEDFDASAYRRSSIDRIRAIIAEHVGEEATAAFEAPAARSEEDNLLATLEASVAAARAAKAA